MTDLTRYSLFSKKVQLDPITNEPQARVIPGQTLLDHFIPGEQLYLAQNNEYTTQAEIENNSPPGTKLLLVDRNDLIYGSEAAAAELKKVLPIDYLAGAYASVFKGGCVPMNPTRPLKVAVVDFSNNYDSGNANISTEISRQLVHDSCGAIDTKLLKDLANRQNAIQFRLGLKGEHPTFAKGMLNPLDFQKLFPNGNAPDLILSSDSFKGNKVAPGLYEYDPAELFLGIKNDAQRTSASISELINIYPQAATDVLPIVHAQAQILAANSRDVVTIAAQALNDYYLDGMQDDPNDEKANSNTQDEFKTPKLIEMALKSGRYNLLDSKQVQDWLEDRINASWKNLSYGDIPQLNSNNATVLPAYDLKYGEVAIPWLADGEELIFYRSPIVNRNGIVTVKNNLNVWQGLKELGADPNIMYVNVQTLDRIEREDPTTYANLLEQYGSKEKLSQGFQTLMEATQMDFDGDTGNVIERSTVPHLYDAVKQNEHPDRKLGNFHKSEKNLPIDWTLPQIAEHIRPGYVGVVYSHKRRLEFSRGEIDVAIDLNDIGLMNRFADEYFTRARKLLFKSRTDESQLAGKSITTGANKPVTLDPQVRAAATDFVNSFDELEIVEKHGQVGGYFVLDKMLRLRSQFQFLKTDRTYQFTSPTGDIKQAFSSQLIQAIDTFEKLPLKDLWGKTDKLEELKDYAIRYQKLSKLIEREVDLSQPIELIGSFQKFDRKTNRTVQTNYLETIDGLSLAAPKSTTSERLRLYQGVLDECIVVTSQLNQDAVDVFKSANIIHDEISHVLSTECARSTFDSIAGKTRAKSYQDGRKPEPTGCTLPDLLQDLCNQHYQPPFDSKQQVSNPDLMRSFRDIPVSSQASAIAQFYLSDDQQIVERLKEIGYNQRLSNGKKAYLEIEVGNSAIKLFDLNGANFKYFKESTTADIILDFNLRQALIQPDAEHNRLANLDPKVCQMFAQKYPNGLTISKDKFNLLVQDGKIDLHFLNDDKKEIGSERKDNLQRLRQAFASEGIEPLEALAAIAQGTNRSRAGYLIAAYPDALTEHIKSIPVDNLIFNAIDPESKEAVNRAVKAMANNPFEFQIRSDGKLLIEAPGNLTVGFLGNLPETGKYQIDNRIKTSSSLPAGIVGAGSLVAEAYCFSLKLKEPGQGLIATNLTAAGKKITNSQERSAVDLALSLDPVRTLPYSVNIMGMDCPISHASSGLAEIWATQIDGSAELEFKEFKYNPLNQGTGKPSFSAVLEREGIEYYLSGIIPERDRADKKVVDLYPNYFVKENFSRQVSQSASIVTGYTLQQNIEGTTVKLGDITTASAKQVGVLADLTHNSAREESVLPIPILHSAMAKVQDRLQIDNPEKIYNSALWEVSTPGKLYSPALPLGEDLTAKIDVCRSKSLNDLSANPLLVTRTQQPVIVNSAVEFQEFYQISCPDEKVASVKAFLDLPQQNGKNIPYRFHASGENPHPAYEPEYQRGYSVFLVEPEAVRKKGNNKADPLIARIKQLVDADTKQPLDPQAYHQQLQAAKVVRPIVAKNLQDLGGWLEDAGGFTTGATQIDIDNLTRLPYTLAGIGEEARARFHARTGLTEDKQHTVFYFGSEYLRDRFVSSMGNAPLPLDCPSQKSRLALIYAAVVPTTDLNSYLKEDRNQYSYNCDADGQKINPILSTYNVNKLGSLPARAATDISMGFAANKYIGKSLLNSPSRTDLYQDSYAENANTDRYQAGDVVMVSGNRFDGKSVIRSTIEPFFEQNYLPLLKAACQAKATIVFGDGNSVDALAKKYLSEAGYTVLEHPHGYNEAIPQEWADRRKQELAGVIAQSPFQPDIPTPESIEPIEPPELEIPVYTRKKKTAATPAGMSLV
ncbi:hypothetical protein [Chamaesiphon sp.]|uniref:hypothetical protein n=1 Tax=Chamaesiphon sp. TaxID=2814140 RepID=UPI00359315E6